MKIDTLDIIHGRSSGKAEARQKVFLVATKGVIGANSI